MERHQMLLAFRENVSNETSAAWTFMALINWEANLGLVCLNILIFCLLDYSNISQQIHRRKPDWLELYGHKGSVLEIGIVFWEKFTNNLDLDLLNISVRNLGPNEIYVAHLWNNKTWSKLTGPVVENLRPYRIWKYELSQKISKCRGRVTHSQF